MKYYKIEIERRFPDKDRVLGHANGEHISNANFYFDRIGKGEIIKDTPVFDYFFLQSFGSKEEWEWRLQDVHGGMGVYPTGGYWYISNDFKLLLENFYIAPEYHFYETKLLYKGNKYTYWIFQFPIDPLSNFNYNKCHFYLDGQKIEGILNAEQYDDYDYEVWKKTKKKIEWKKVALNNNYDFFIDIDGHKIISEKLKNAIEQIQLKGILFSELDYEVVVE